MTKKKDDKKSKKAEKPKDTDKVVERMKAVPKSVSGPRMISVKLIHPNPYNCNKMDPAEREALKADMKEMKHPSMLDPLRVRQDGKEFEIIDGQHRWEIAVELKWPEISCVVFDMPQDDALLWNFRINRQRGTHDPLKEATFFKHLTDDVGLTQKRIGELLNLDRSVVSRRLSILNIDEEIMESVNPEEIPVSVLEVVAQAPTKEFQDELLRDYTRYGSSVEDLQDAVTEHKEELEKEKRFNELIVRAKFPNCPNCGSKATAFWWTEPYVTDGHGYNHVWNPDTGKTKRQDDQKERAVEAGHPDQSRILSVFRHNLAPSEIIAKARKNFSDIAEVMFHKADTIKLLHSPSDDADDIDDEWLSERGITLSDTWTGHPEITITADQGVLHVVLEPKSYQTGEKTKVIVSHPSPYSEGGLEKAEKLLNLLIEGKLTFKKLAKDKRKGKLKLPKTPIMVQPTDKEMWELEAKEVYKALARFCNHGKHGKCKVPHELLMCPGHNCPDCLVREVLQEEGIWGTPAMGDPKYVNKAETYEHYFLGDEGDGKLSTPIKINLVHEFKELLETGFMTDKCTGGSRPVKFGDRSFVISISSKTEKEPKQEDDDRLRKEDGLRCAAYKDKKYCNRCVNGDKMQTKGCFVEPKKQEFKTIKKKATKKFKGRRDNEQQG